MPATHAGDAGASAPARHWEGRRRGPGCARHDRGAGARVVVLGEAPDHSGAQRVVVRAFRLEEGRAVCLGEAQRVIEQGAEAPLTVDRERQMAAMPHLTWVSAPRRPDSSWMRERPMRQSRRQQRLVDTSSLAELVTRARQGDASASSALIEVVYPELRRLARYYLASERPEHTLQTTALVNEAWLRLFGRDGVAVNDRSHLVALMATQMRRALVDHARHRNAEKGPGAGVRVAVDDAAGLAVGRDDDVLALDEALRALEAIDARAASVVELRYFGGFDEREAAAALGISVSTLKRDWVFARAWLFDRLRGGD